MIMNGVVWGFIMLVIGILNFGFFQKQVYPKIRASYEEAKVTGTKTIDPDWISDFIKMGALIIMPAVFFWFGYKGYFPDLADITSFGAQQ